MSSGPRLACLLAAALLGLPAGALAQDDAPPLPAPEPVQTPAEEAPTDIEALEVIGERLDATDVQDEAQAISAFSAEDLDRANIFNVDSLAFSVPGLHVGQAGQQAIITLRGIGTENASITGEPGVAFHVDGINYNQPSAARVAFFDLETLDVKRGPQGLLGGKNSNSGSINVVTKKPHDEYEVDADVLFGNYDRVRARGALNIPLGEFAATRFAFFHEDRDGYLDNLLVSDSRDPFDTDDFGMRAHLRLTPTDTLDMVLTYNYFKQTGNGPQADIVPRSAYTPNCAAERLAAGFPAETRTTPAAACFTDPPTIETRFINGIPIPFVIPGEMRPAGEDDDKREILSDFLASQSNRFWGWTGTIDWDAPVLPLLGETRVRAIGGFQRSALTFKQDFDATDIEQSGLDTDRGADQHTAELQWGGTLAERLDWQLSGFYMRETGRRNLLSENLTQNQQETGGEQPSFVEIEQNTENNSYGAAAHGTYRISDTVRFQLGGRWIKDKKHTWLLRERGGTQALDAFTGCTGALSFVAVPNTRNDRVPARRNTGCTLGFRGTNWGSVIDWRPFGGDHLLYAKIDRGFKSGGFRSGGRGEYLPERIWAYALGSKSTAFDNRVEFNVEGFFYAYENMQLVVLDGFSLRTENADTRMYGFDVEARANPIPGLHLSAILSHLKTETLDYYSLDPADVSNPEGFPEGTDRTRVANFRNRRLDVRRRSEDNAEEFGGRGVQDFLDGNCLARPPAPAGSIPVRCGSLGDLNGLDDFSGNDLSRSPEWKVTLTAEYEFSLGRFGFLTPRVQYTWQDDTYYRAFNRDFDLQEAHHLTDAKLIWRGPEDRWQAEIFVTNIEDEEPKQNILVGSAVVGSPALAWYGQPRFYGVRVGFRY